MTSPVVMNPFVAVTRSARVSNARSKYGGIYRYAAVVETTDGLDPKMVSEHCKTVVQVVRSWAPEKVGKTYRCAYWQSVHRAERLAAHLNRLHQWRLGLVSSSVTEVDAEVNVEFQRELIEAMGGLEAYMAACEAQPFQEDTYGRLWRRATAGGPIVAVEVTCPSTGRRYALRVPPEMMTAHEAVAWTFGLTVETYNPNQQS
jgi:hypothetical protein